MAAASHGLFPHVLAAKAYALVLVAALLPSLIAISAGALQFDSVERRLRQAHLSSICTILRLELEEERGGFEAILRGSAGGADHQAAAAGRLNVALQPVVFRVAQAYPRVEAGYYSRAVQAEVAGVHIDGSPMAIRPVYEEEFPIYRTGRPSVLMQAGRIVQLMPVFSRGEIVGHVWAAMEDRDMVRMSISSATAMLWASAVTAAAMLCAVWRVLHSTSSWCSTQVQRAGDMANATAAAVVHELRNPIAVARGLTELIMSRETDVRKKMWLSNLMRQMDRMNVLASDYLMYARPREARISSVPVAEVLGEVKSQVEHLAGQSGVEMALEVPDPSIEALCDPDQLEQVLLNLVRNAIEALDQVPEGQRVVNLSAMPAGDGRVAIRVRDSGPGISQEDLPNLFKPFFTTRQKGTGLGLAVSKRLVEQVGGTLHAETGDGCTQSVVTLRTAER